MKIPSSRKFFNEVNEKFPSLPFSLRACEDENTAKVSGAEASRFVFGSGSGTGIGPGTGTGPGFGFG